MRKDEWEEEFKKWRTQRNSQKQTKKDTEKNNKNSIQKKPATVKIQEKTHQNPKPHKLLVVLAFAIPAAVLIYGLYINYLPFGWEKTYELTFNNEGIATPISDEIYLTDENGRRLLAIPQGIDGQINVVIEPNVVLENSTTQIEIEGNNVYLGTSLETDQSEINWNHIWNFNVGIPQELEGKTEHALILNGHTQGCARFDATKEHRLSLPNSEDLFETDPMTIYLRWKPSETSKILGNWQQLIGHFNWEIWQGENQVQFRVGRMNDANGPSYSISHEIREDFFEKEHELLAIYAPDQIKGEGYIELWIDGIGKRVAIGRDIIWADYNSNRNLNFGWSPHNYEKYPHFDGCVYEAKIANHALQESKTRDTIKISETPIEIPIIGNGELNTVKVTIRQ